MAKEQLEVFQPNANAVHYSLVGHLPIPTERLRAGPADNREVQLLHERLVRHLEASCQVTTTWE